jgi:hypothetical protein
LAQPSRLDVARLLRVLDEYDVEYVLVGGVAAGAHGATRVTEDFDMVARRAAEEPRSARCGDAFARGSLACRRTRVVPYDELITRAEQMRLHGVVVYTADLDDIVASKEWANRPKDQAALPEFGAIQHRRSPARPARSIGRPRRARGVTGEYRTRRQHDAAITRVADPYGM